MLDLVEITENNESNKIILKKLLKIHATTQKDIKKTDFKDEGIYDVFRYSANLAGFYYVYYINNSSNALLLDNFEITGGGFEFDNLELRDKSECIKNIEPGQEDFLLARRKKGKNSKTSFYNKTRILQLFTDEEVINAAIVNPDAKKQYPNLGIVVHKFSYQGGEALYYQNIGKKMGKVKASFKNLLNYEVNGSIENHYEAYIPPKEGFLLHLKLIDIFEASSHSLSYSVSSE